MIVTKEVAGVLAVALILFASFPYLHSIVRGKSQPHLFSWIIWSLTTAIATAAQVTKGAGPGAWVTGFSCTFDCVVMVLAIFKGETSITRTDWISFILALIALPIWYFTSDPLGAVVLSSIICVLAGYPTIRKTAANPLSEPSFFWIILLLRSVLGLVAIEVYSLNTTLYSATGTLVTLTVMAQVIIGRAKHRRVLARTNI